MSRRGMGRSIQPKYCVICNLRRKSANNAEKICGSCWRKEVNSLGGRKI